ncbi:hypothetical protein DYB26_004109 [Aphanomyces astaci]|uniref:Uncharacterized protein n=1 Tax=Aphanomyces astaci TaxID=112090 RepID=A0A397BQK2_APHAT|nr:hypothetical protein DYB36_011166 [Aphanomyces astaci]RHY79842.1 hypothetical protein DYB26_004109 [Aphanomyces astaci]
MKSSQSDLTSVAVAAVATTMHHTDNTEPSAGGYRGRCLYKTGKCENERALKTNGQAHNLCDMHRLRQNQNQRKLDGKNRHNRTGYSPYERNSADPVSPDHTISPVVATNVDPVKPEPSTMHSPRSSECSYTTPPTQIELPPRTSNRHYFAPPINAPAHQTPSSPLQYLPYPTVPRMSNSATFPTLSHLRRSTSQPTIHYDPSQQQSQPVKPETFTDDITVPTPSYLKGEAREAFRSRVLQKLVNIISEEVMTTQHHHHPQTHPAAYDLGHADHFAPHPYAPHHHHPEYTPPPPATAFGYNNPASYSTHQQQQRYPPALAPIGYPRHSPPTYDDPRPPNSFHPHHPRMRFQALDGTSGPLPKLYPTSSTLPSLTRPPPPKESSSPNRNYLL